MLAFSIPPDAAVVLLTAGLLLIDWELNRPGSILPGACGLLAALLAVASLSRAGSPLVLAGLAAAACLLLLSTRRALPLTLEVAATLLLIASFYAVGRNTSTYHGAVHITIAILCGLVAGAGSLLLTRVARRARQNKGLD